MHHLVETTKGIKLQLYEASSEAHAPFKIVVVGVEGAGKTTTVNQLTRALTKSDDALTKANPTLTITDTFSLRYAFEVAVDTAVVETAEAAMYKDIQDRGNPFNVDYEQLNEQGDDILPTGTGCAITALPTTLKFDPDADVLILSLTYRPSAEVKDVLQQAADIAKQVNEAASPDDDSSAFGDDGAAGSVQLAEGEDASLIAHQACAILNIETSSGLAIEKIASYAENKDSTFALPPHLELLLGRTRKVKIAGPTAEEMFTELNRRLTLLTVGNWSNWGVLENVEVIIPSASERLTVVDVPGLGVDRANPFRMEIVHKTITNVQCSSLLICLKCDRGPEASNVQTEGILQEAGVYEELFGEVLERRVGKVLVSQSLDWLKEKKIAQLEKRKQRLDENEAREAGRKLQSRGQDFLRGMFQEALVAKGVSTERVPDVLERFTRCFAVDVRGKIEEMSGLAEFSLTNVVAELAATATDALERHRQVLLQRLVVECVLPFYEEHAKLGLMRDFKPEDPPKITVPGIASVIDEAYKAGELALMGHIQTAQQSPGQGPILRVRGSQGTAVTASAGDERFAGQANSKLREELNEQVMQPRLVQFHDDAGTAFMDRWDHDTGFDRQHFFEYRKERGRQLGIDLKSAMPHMTLLRDALMPEIAKHSVKPLQDALRELKGRLIEVPIKAMATKIEEMFISQIKPTRDANDTVLIVIQQVQMIIQSSLRAWRDQEVRRFGMIFTKLLQDLEDARPEIMRDVMTQQLRKVATSFSNKTARKRELAKKAKPCAKKVVDAMMSFVHTDILALLQQKQRRAFESATREAHRQVVAAIRRGDMQELTRSGAFAVSHHYARLTAGMIKGLREAHIVDGLLDGYHKLDQIISLANQPPLKFATGDGLASLLALDEPGASEMDCSATGGSSASAAESGLGSAAGPSSTGGGSITGWVCPNCECPACDTPLQEALRTDSEPCGRKPGNCWCEAVPVGREYCRLCVRYFRHNHKLRSLATERRRQQNQKRKRVEAGLVDELPVAQRTTVAEL